MPRGRRSYGGFGRDARPKRLSAWALGPGMGNIITGDPLQISSSASGIIGDGVTPIVPHLTVVRMRGIVQVQLATADAVRAGFQYVIAIGIVNSDAFVVGVSAVPDAFDDADWPGWLWYQMGMINTSVAVLSATNNNFATVFHEIDSKAMRKLRQNEVLFAMCQPGEIGTATMDIKLASRVLVKLP